MTAGTTDTIHSLTTLLPTGGIGLHSGFIGTNRRIDNTNYTKSK